jgi:hypothetical protein
VVQGCDCSFSQSTATLREWCGMGGGRYVYVVKGLWLEPGSAEWVPPCTAHHVSRWVRVASSGGCSGDVLSGGTANVVQSAISAHDGGAAEATNYTDGLTANKDGGACDPWFGPLAEAEARCTNDPSCRYLQHDDGNAANWRLCSSVAFDPDGTAAVKVKPARYWGANPTIRDVVVADYTASEPSPQPQPTMGPPTFCWEKYQLLSGYSCNLESDLLLSTPGSICEHLLLAARANHLQRPTMAGSARWMF